MVHRIFHVLGDVLRHPQPRPPLGAGVLSADAFVPAVFRRFYGRAVGTFWKIIRMFSYSAAYFCPVYGRIYVVCHGLHPLGRLHGLQRRRFVPTGSGAAAGDPQGLPRGICLTLLALFQYSVWRSDIAAEKLWALPLLCAAVRCVSAGAVLGLAPLESSGYRTMEHSRSAAAAAWVMAAVCVGLGFLLPERGFLCVPVAVASAGLTVFLLRRNLGGMCGDISGAAITLGEACGCAALLL